VRQVSAEDCCNRFHVGILLEQGAEAIGPQCRLGPTTRSAKRSTFWPSTSQAFEKTLSEEIAAMKKEREDEKKQRPLDGIP